MCSPPAAIPHDSRLPIPQTRRKHTKSMQALPPPESVVLEGNIKKRSTGMFPSWQVRWFIIEQSHYVRYFEKKDKAKLLGVLDLRGCSHVEEHTKGRANELTIHLGKGQGKMRLMFQGAGEAGAWNEVLSKSLRVAKVRVWRCCGRGFRRCVRRYHGVRQLEF